MRKFVAVALCMTLCGCYYAESNGVQMSGLNERADGRFAYETFTPTLDYDEWSFGYVVDTETGVTYIVFDNNNGKNSVGGITPLLRQDGTPTIDDRYAKR